MAHYFLKTRTGRTGHASQTLVSIYRHNSLGPADKHPAYAPFWVWQHQSLILRWLTTNNLASWDPIYKNN